MQSIEIHTVSHISSPIRIQEYGITIFKSISTKSGFKKAIKHQRVLINTVVATTATYVQKGDRIELLPEKEVIKKIFKLSFPVIFEDDDIAIIHKPSGFPTNGNYFKTIENALPYNLNDSKAIDALQFPKPVHRLDNPTSGLLLIAKTKSAQIALYAQFKKQLVSKVYHAVVIGTPQSKGIINTSIEKKEAFTQYITLQSVFSLQNDSLSLVKLFPTTGRTHQLRIHLASIGCPIVGDQVYGKPEENYKKGVFLCATEITFTHPKTQEKLSFAIRLPNKFKSLLDREDRRFFKFNRSEKYNN